MTVVADRIARLRALMAEKGIDAYVVPTADFHQSEYVGEHFKARKFITGFSGSAGTAVITKTGAYLWTDGRYFVQAARRRTSKLPESCSNCSFAATRSSAESERHFASFRETSLSASSVFLISA